MGTAWVALLAAVVCPCALDAQRAGAAPAKSSACHERLATIAQGAPPQGTSIPLNKVRHVAPKFPVIPAGTVARGSSIPIYEMLIGADGKVSQVWTLHPMKFEPPFPAFDRAIVLAIKQWEFEPPRVNGVATPRCMSMTLNIDFN